METKVQDFYLFGAYYDQRARNKQGPSIRILGQVENTKKAVVDTYCQIWFEDHSGPVIRKVASYTEIRSEKPTGLEKGHLYSYLISCHIPRQYKGTVPQYVSLVEKKCDKATTLLKVTFNPLGDLVSKSL